jgi:electron transport complex protein RnfG
MNMVKLGVALALYATIACVGLAFVYTGTKPIIDVQAEKDLQAALKELFPEADEFKDITGSISSGNGAVSFSTEYAAYSGGKVSGAAIQASAGSYGGAIKILAGVGSDGKITRVKILEHSDTPGLGANAASASYFVDKPNKITFYGQFAGKSVRDSFAVKDDVVSITASTITSRAVATAVKAAGDAGYAWISSQGGSK